MVSPNETTSWEDMNIQNTKDSDPRRHAPNQKRETRNGFSQDSCILSVLCIKLRTFQKQPHRKPVGEDYRSRRFRSGLPKSGLDLASAHWPGDLISVPFLAEARVQLSSTMNASATDTGSHLRDPSEF